MFETLFKQPAVVARYREGPLSEPRERFLEECASRGYSRSMLQKIAWVQLALAPGVATGTHRLTASDIEQAVGDRTRFKRVSRGSRDSQAQGSHQLFIRIGTKWIRSLDRLAAPDQEEVPFASETAAFVSHLREERGLSPVTIATRCERLAWFFKSLVPPRDSLRAISIADVDAFIKAKADGGWMRSSLSSLASSLRSFFRYAEGQGGCAPGIAAGIESPRLYVREGLPVAPRWEDVQRLLAGTQGPRPADIRDYPVLILLALYGLRRGEVAQLTLDDFDWAGERILVQRPKQRRTQTYPLLPTLGEAILRYLRDVRPQCAHRALFLTLDAPFRPLSGASISATVRARLKTLGIPLSRRGAHCLRHACAGHLLASGFSLKQIGDHLGHRCARSTLTYAKVDVEGLRQVAELDLGGLL